MQMSDNQRSIIFGQKEDEDQLQHDCQEHMTRIRQEDCGLVQPVCQVDNNSNLKFSLKRGWF